ncbi:MAG: class I SAM-dependent methyltransferase [Anaerolineae bacterium]|nr:class I SAM-dependent methyltransferase [Anaerolineae bacterium]
MTIRKRLFAWMYHNLLSDRGSPDMSDPLTRDVRAPLLAQAAGRVLEIGAGDGANLPLYPPGVRLTSLEPNPHLHLHLDRICAEQHVICDAIVEAPGEAIPYPDGYFDTVVSIHVLCSVADQTQVLTEIRRVLRPGGLFLFLEHVTAPPNTPTHHMQRLVNPLWKTVGDGCHLTRDTGAAIRAAGFEIVEINTFETATFPAIVSPHITGSARP